MTGTEGPLPAGRRLRLAGHPRSDGPLLPRPTPPAPSSRPSAVR
ncbi:hypothetical protein [Micromonospora sp. NPDC051296]